MLEKILKKAGDALICPVAVIVRDNKVLVGHRHYTPDRWKKISAWTLPGGRCDVDESVGETLRREIKEEIDVDDVEIVDYLGESPGVKEDDRVLVFLCKTNQEPKLMEPEKFSEWKWVSANEFPDDFINNHVREIILDCIG
jgi:ADP-ribose pyrophosphatase YjhB (NUDIX family)